MKPNARRPEKQPDTEFFTTLRERVEVGLRADETDRKEAQHDTRFAAGDQWEPGIKEARRKNKRPVLTENRLGPSIQQIVNDGRQNKPSILCSPLDGGTEESAEYFEGRIRQLEYESDADVAYDTARRQTVICGRGFYRVVTKQRGNDEQDQYVCIDAIDNQFAVIWDAASKRYDLADADWFVVTRLISTDQHERDFGTDTEASRNGFFLKGENPAPGWMGVGADGMMIQVADYYYRDYDDLNDEGYPKCKICATNGIEVFDETEWLDPEGVIPVIPQFGEQDVVEDEKRNYSLIRFAKDPQRLVNLYASNIAEEIGRIPKTPYLAAEGQIDGHEQEWATLNEVQRAVLLYKTRSVDGDEVGAPQRNNAEPPIQALVTGYLQAVDSLKAATGIFDASLGAGPGDTAGIAIAKRQKESDVSNFHFSDNEARSRKKLGRILLRILPLLDGDEPADKPVRAADGKVKLTRINEPYAHPKTGKPVLHNMQDPGRHEIGVATGPSYTSQRDEEHERMGELLQGVPDLIWTMGDLYFATSDGPGAKAMAERMERAIALRMPGLIENQNGDPRKQLQQTTLQLQQMSQVNKELIDHVHALAQKIETKQAELDYKFKSDALKSWTTIKTAEITGKLKADIADADREADHLVQFFDQAHDVGMAAMDHAHQVLQNQQGQDGAQQQQQQQHEHEADQATQAQISQELQQQQQPEQQQQ